MLIAIEGVDASGKATQSRRLADVLGSCASLLSFPNYGSPTGQLIRNLLSSDTPLLSESEHSLLFQSLMATNRYEAFDTLEMYRNSMDKVLILDRYYASGLVYGQADGLSLEYLLSIHKALPAPDIWIYLEVPPEESAVRRPLRRDRYERRVGMMSRVAQLYSDLFRVQRPTPGVWAVIDGIGPIHEVQQRILDELQPVLKKSSGQPRQPRQPRQL